MRESTSFGHSGRPAALCAPRWVARREVKNLPYSSGRAVAMSSTRGCPARTVSPQPQYRYILPLGRSYSCSTTVSSPGVGGDPFSTFGEISFNVGASCVPAGTACAASARLGLRLV